MRLAPAAASLLALTVAGCGGEPSALDPHGRGAREIAELWWVMFGAGTAVMVLVLVVLIRVARRHRAVTPADEAERSGRRWVLLGGVVLPIVVIVPISVLTLQTGNALNAPADDDAVEIELTGVQFWWEVVYPETGAVTANELHIPVDRDVHITMGSRDVIHSFWVPSLHGKVDLLPGETTELVLQADDPGEYEALCAEFCGIQHAHMRLVVIAHEADEFDEWLAGVSADARPPSTAQAREGAAVFHAVGCASCHTIRGTAAQGQVGPDLTHIASRPTLGAGTIDNTRGNLGGWIANPQRIKPGNHMPPSILEGTELIALLDYLESLE